MVTATILDFKNYHFLFAGVQKGEDASLCQISSISVYSLWWRSNLNFFMAAVHHLGSVLGERGPLTKGTWWSLSLCKICLWSMQWFP